MQDARLKTYQEATRILVSSDGHLSRGDAAEGVAELAHRTSWLLRVEHGQKRAARETRLVATTYGGIGERDRKQTTNTGECFSSRYQTWPSNWSDPLSSG